MKVGIFGDTHNDVAIAEEVALRHGAQEMIILGDVWDITGDRKLPSYLLMGNHERHSLWQAILRTGEGAGDNVHLLHEHDAFEIDDIKFGALGKIDAVSHEAVRGKIWLGEEPDIWLKRKTIDELPFGKEIDILLTHDSPYPFKFPWRHFTNRPPLNAAEWDEDNMGYVEVAGSHYLTQIIKDLQPKYALSGHFHMFYDRMIHDTRAITFPAIQRELNHTEDYLFAMLDTKTKVIEIRKII